MIEIKTTDFFVPSGEMGDELKSELAAVQHEIWAHWMQYLFSICIEEDDGCYIIPSIFADRWKRQIATHYDHMSPKEQASDLEQVDRFMPILLEIA